MTKNRLSDRLAMERFAEIAQTELEFLRNLGYTAEPPVFQIEAHGSSVTVAFRSRDKRREVIARFLPTVTLPHGSIGPLPALIVSILRLPKERETFDPLRDRVDALILAVHLGLRGEREFYFEPNSDLIPEMERILSSYRDVLTRGAETMLRGETWKEGLINSWS